MILAQRVSGDQWEMEPIIAHYTPAFLRSSLQACAFVPVLMTSALTPSDRAISLIEASETIEDQ